MKRRTIDLSDELYETMDLMKKAHGVSYTSIVRLALIDFFAKHKKDSK